MTDEYIAEDELAFNTMVRDQTIEHILKVVGAAEREDQKPSGMLLVSQKGLDRSMAGLVHGYVHTVGTNPAVGDEIRGSAKELTAMALMVMPAIQAAVQSMTESKGDAVGAEDMQVFADAIAVGRSAVMPHSDSTVEEISQFVMQEFESVASMTGASHLQIICRKAYHFLSSVGDQISKFLEIVVEDRLAVATTIDTTKMLDAATAVIGYMNVLIALLAIADESDRLATPEELSSIMVSEA